MDELNSCNSTDVAIIGMAGRFPNADGPEELWANLSKGRNCISFFNEEELKAEGISAEVLKQSHYVCASPVLRDIEYFDAAYFGITPREAELMDPQHRLFLECCSEALDHAGYDPGRYSRDIGVFAGARTNTYLINNLLSSRELVESLGEFYVGLGNDLAFLTSRVSHVLNLRGPSCSVHTACSTSLVGVHLACQSLLAAESDMALAGGVAINIPHISGYMYEDGNVMSPDGYCRVFDAGARGTVFGSGVAVVLLKRAEDAIADGDHILAIIKGSAINNDGSVKASFTAPGIRGQIRVIQEAQKVSGVPANTVSYVECHGTGTLLGDAIEIRALTRAFQADAQKPNVCAIGSVKSNLGHLDAASGVTGLIKVVLGLQHKMLPPSLHFKEPNPQIDFANSPFYVNTELTPWNSEGPRRAGVSAFGVGGTNAHIIVEEAPRTVPGEKGRAWQLLPLSARTKTALVKTAHNLAGYLRQHESIELADVAYTLQVGRRQFDHRLSIVCRERDEAASILEAVVDEQCDKSVDDASHKIAFLFPGQGSQYPAMGLQLYQNEKVFRKSLEQCGKILQSRCEMDLYAMLRNEGSEEIRQTWWAQPTLLSLEYGLVQLWNSWGIKPEAMLGHSLGEYTAACIAEVMSLEDALNLVAVRGKLMQQMTPGRMLAVTLGEQEVRTMLSNEIALAAVNAANLCVLSGPCEPLEKLAEDLQQRGVGWHWLRTSHAFHSAMMEPMMESFLSEVRKVRLSAPKIPYISNVTGTWIKEEEARDPRYWVTHLRQTVQFGPGLQRLVNQGKWILLEVGPGQVLRRLGQQQGIAALASMPRDRGDAEMETMQQTLGQLWETGITVDWGGLHADERRKRTPLPTYPFERKRYWIERSTAAKEDHKKLWGGTRKTEDVSQWFWHPAWKLCPRVTNESEDAVLPDSTGTWLVFADDQGLGLEASVQLESRGLKVIKVFKGEAFKQVNETLYTIDPRKASDYGKVVSALGDAGHFISNVAHFWGIDLDDAFEQEPAFFERCQSAGLLSLLFLAQAMNPHPPEWRCKFWVISNNVVQIESQDQIICEKTGVLALAKTLPQEDQAFSVSVIDIGKPQDRLQIAGWLLTDFNTLASEPIIAYRGPYRWTQTYDRLSVNPNCLPASVLKQHGVYLITGGLGAVGLLIAEWIVRTVKGKLVLVSRSPFPSRDQWQQTLEHLGTDSLQARKIRQLIALEEMGAEIEVVTADVSNLGQMRDALQKARDRFGNICGVIHAAGITTGTSVFCLACDLNSEECEIQMQPKAHGLQVLKQLFHNDDVDFVLAMSSNAAVLGGLGFTAYAAANLFMDSFVLRQQAEHSKIRWISANWDHWPEETKKLSDFRTSMDEFAMTREEAEEAFFKVLSVPGSGQIVVSTGNLQERMDLWIRQRSASKNTAESPGSKAVSKAPKPKVRSVYVEPRNQEEQIITSLWEEALGVEKIGVNDDFFELGGHSILAIRLMAEIRQKLAREFPLAVFFQGPTVAQMAARIAENTAGENKRQEAAKFATY